MTVLITGATGLVGSRLLGRLASAGVECRALVRGDVVDLPAGVTQVRGDILDPPSLVGAVTGVSAVVHLAAAFRTPDEAAIWRVNLDGTRHLIDAVTTHAPTARFVLASTSNVYGPNADHPGLETDSVDPPHPYPASKVKAEEVLRESGLTWAVLRFPFVYGDQDGHIEDAIKILGGMNRHPAERYSLVHHRDIAAAVRMALDGAMDGQIVNITDDAPTSIFEMARVAGLTYERSSAPLDDPWRGQMDGTLARSLGFRPSVATIYQAQLEGIL